MAIYSKFNSIWSTENGNAFVGKIFVGDEMKYPKDVFYSADTNSVLDILKKINGFWGAVTTNGNKAGWIASDRIRSYPVFYAQKGEDLFISSDAYWVREQCSIIEINKDAEEEFLMTGYVTGNETLFVGLKQIQQGEVVFFEWSDNIGKYTFSSYQYYRYLHKDPDEASEQILMQKLDDAMLASFNRLIKFADSRTIIIPLSGGYDSRLVALMLKRLGYDNLIAYTYGVKNNEEAIISKEIADKLNIPWFFIEYTQEKWYEMYHSDEFKNYEKFAGELASLPHCQDWIAVKELKDKKMIPKNSVFVPGLSADLPAGSRSKRFSHIYQQKATFSEAVEALEEFHYSLSTKTKTPTLTMMNKLRITNRLGADVDYINAASVFESFDVGERQAKYINNSIRVYEFWNFSWWTPYWDIDFLDFWSSTPLNYRINQKLYLQYIITQSIKFKLFIGNELYRNETKVNVLITLRSSVGKICKKIFPETLWIKLRDKTQPKVTSIFEKDPLAWYGCWESSEIDEHLKNGNNNIMSMLADDYLKKLKISGNYNGSNEIDHNLR